MWPDVGIALNGEEFARAVPVHRRFSKRLLPLDRDRLLPRDCALPLDEIYLLDRRAMGKPTVGHISASAAMIQLLGHSIVGGAAEALGLQKERLSMLAALLSQVKMVRLFYPSGLENLDDVTRIIE